MDITVDVAAVEEYIVSDVGKGKARRRIVLGLLNTEAIINDLNYSIYIYRPEDRAESAYVHYKGSQLH